MGKLLVSLSQEAEEILRNHVKERYNNKRGALSWVIEQLIRESLTN